MSGPEKTGYWISVVILVGFATLFSWGIASSVVDGRLEALAKHGNGRIFLLSKDPVGFCLALIPHLLSAGMFWWAAFWVWLKRIRAE